MYYYIFEPPHGSHDYERMAQVKEYLATLGIAGEMTSPTPGKDLEDLVESAIQKRYSTVVAVGGSALINRVARALEPHDAVFGIIPLQEHPDITKIVGVSDWKAAAEHLKRRRLRDVQIGLYNDQEGFLTPVTIVLNSDQRAVIKADKYSLESFGGTITVSPSIPEEEGGKTATLDLTITYPQPAKAGFLSSLFKRSTPQNLNTQLVSKNFQIQTDPVLPVSVAGAELGPTPCTFSVQKKPLKLIVAKGNSI